MIFVIRRIVIPTLPGTEKMIRVFRQHLFSNALRRDFRQRMLSTASSQPGAHSQERFPDNHYFSMDITSCTSSR